MNFLQLNDIVIRYNYMDLRGIIMWENTYNEIKYFIGNE